MKSTLHLGILQCDDVAEPLRASYGDYPQMIQQALSTAGQALRFSVFAAHRGELPRHIDEFDGFITSGSRHSVNDGFAWIAALAHFIQRLHAERKKFLGICFGHQLAACALGGRVERSTRGWGVGVSTNRLLDRRPWMTPYQDVLNIIVSHRDQITVPPDGAQLLAASDFCPYYMLQYDNHMMTVQGHPEFSAPYSAALTRHRQGIIPAGTARRALQSLDTPTDHPILISWILSFLQD